MSTVARAALAAIILFLPAAACFRHLEVERQLDDAAFLTFPQLDSPAQCTLIGDGRIEFEIRPKSGATYRVPAGTWTVEVTRDGESLMRRKLFFAAGESRALDLR